MMQLPPALWGEYMNTASFHEETTAQTSGLGRKLVLLMAVASGLIVANLYYAQPLLNLIASDLGLAEAQVGIVATLTQVGYAVGLLGLVPLGDAHDRRALIYRTVLCVAAATAAFALAPGLLMLSAASFAIGVTAAATQIVVPFAASLADEHERGRVVGTVMSGLLIGILGARTLSGIVGAQFGWRTMFWIAAALMLMMAVGLRAALPEDHPQAGMPYIQLLRSLATLIRGQPVLREASMFGAMLFGGFSAFWVVLVFFLEKQYHYGSAVAGLFGLVGVAGALAASLAGRLSDRMPARRITGAGLLIVLLSYAVFWLLGSQLWGLILGVILLDLGVQAGHIANQTRVYALIPQARSRLNTVYMVSYFIGGSVGTIMSTLAWSYFGWNGVCAVGGLMAGVGLALFAARRQ
jgi:predicted MFS family arabinose efflux permease